MKRIKFFSYHGCQDEDKRRDNSPAADTKIDYIIEVLNRCGYAVDHISRAGSAESDYIPAYVEQKGENTFRYFASFGKQKNPFLRVLGRWYMEFQFFRWCMFNIKRGEQIIVYHSLGYDSAFIKLKKLKGIRIIGDIEEIYQDVHPQKPSQCKNEYKFIEICDKLMYPNTVLNERLNKTNRPYLVVHGIYKVNEFEPVSFGDDKIHVLYAGTYDPVKGGALAAAQATEFLSNKYHVHITGFGTKEDEKNVDQEVKRIKPISKAELTFHGYLNDVEFMELMHRCLIGLCTQDPTSKLNLTSFPSKILNYISNGLVVLSGRNRCIEESAVGNLIYYYEEQTPEIMAKTIMAMGKPNGLKCKDRLLLLDQQLEKSLIRFLS